SLFIIKRYLRAKVKVIYFSIEFSLLIRHFQKINKSVCLSILSYTASTEPLDSSTICGTCFLVGTSLLVNISLLVN
ncbi:hypothetical protein, partial [Clostridium sp. BL8]|uniref:hypothetical protein n=1 Tax=Clostridium sp. BL8 TaxID=1354301 RepID=UPI001967B810